MKQLLFVICFCVGLSATAQNIKIRGVIKDSIGNPLEFANVIATKQGSKDIESYAITNYEGKFQLDVKANQTYVLKASFLGYETIEMTATVGGEAITQDFVLKPSAAQLDGVEIVYEMPVTVKGDTIIYNADSFTTGEERKLGDVLQNLPGVEVNEEGEIQVEGKDVQKVMVEGKDFFDGDSKLATKNIPANAVDKVEVLRNYNEVNQMRGLGNDQDNIAINIKLKEGKKNFWFGEVTAGGGSIDDNGGYLAHPKLFYYSPKYSLNFITDFNNIGEVPFTFRDYFNFTGGFRNFNRGGGTSFNISDSGLGFAVTQNDRANEIETKFFAGNFSYAVNEKLDVSGFGIASDNTTNIVRNTLRQYTLQGVNEINNSNTDQRNKLAMFKGSAVYKPNADFQLDYDALFKLSSQEENIDAISIVDGIDNTIDERLENQPYSINQNVNAYYTLNDKNIFAGQVQHLYQNEDPFYSAVQDVIPFSGVLPIDDTQNRFSVNQDKNVRTNKIDGKIDYYYVLNNKSNINLTLGGTYSGQQFDSNIFQLLDNGNRLDFSQSVPDPQSSTVFPLENDVKFSFTDLFLGAHYKLKTGKFIVTPGINFHNYSVSSEQLGIETSDNEVALLPDLNVLFEIKSSQNLTFNYAITNQYTDVNDYAEAFVFNNYNSLFRGNRNLENSLSHNVTLSYFSYNMFNYTNISGFLNYSKTIEGFKNQTQILGINRVNSPFNIDSAFPDETISANVRFSKRIKKFQIRTGATVSLSTTNNQINGAIRESENFTQNYNASVRTNFRDWPNFEVGYRLNINDFNNAGQVQKSFTNRPFANFNTRFLKEFTFNAEWEYYDYSIQDSNLENQYSFVNTNLFYQKKDSKWEFQIQVNNVLNTEFINNDNFNEQFNSTSRYFVLPRITMFVVKYEL